MITEINWKALEEAVLTQSSREIEIYTAEHRVLDAAVAWVAQGGAGGAASLEEPLFDAVEALIALRGE